MSVLFGSGESSPFGMIFDGTSDYLSLGSDLTGNADSKVGIFSSWLKIPSGAVAANNIILANSTQRMIVFITTSGTITLLAKTTGAATTLSKTTTGTVNDGKWHHFVASWNLATPTYQAYLDGVSDAAGGTANDNEIDYTGASWAIGALANGTLKFNGLVSEFYFNVAESIDLSTNLGKFYTGKAPNLGGDGSIPTTNQPIVYMPRAGSPGVNLGSGGNFTVQGAVVPVAGPNRREQNIVGVPISRRF